MSPAHVSRLLPILALLASCAVVALPCAAAAWPRGAAGDPEVSRFEDLTEALTPADAPWRRLCERLDATGRLAPELSAPLAAALLELEASPVRAGPHATAAALGATALSAAASAGAEPADLVELSKVLRDLLPPLLERHPAPGVENATPPSVGDPELAAALGSPLSGNRQALRDRFCSLRPGACEGLSEDRVDAFVARLLAARPRQALPAEPFRELSARLAPATGEAPR